MNTTLTEELINDLAKENKILKERVRELEINMEYNKIEAYKKGRIDASIEAIKHLTPSNTK